MTTAIAHTARGGRTRLALLLGALLLGGALYAAAPGVAAQTPITAGHCYPTVPDPSLPDPSSQVRVGQSITCAITIDGATLFATIGPVNEPACSTHAPITQRLGIGGVAYAVTTPIATAAGVPIVIFPATGDCSEKCIEKLAADFAKDKYKQPGRCDRA